MDDRGTAPKVPARRAIISLGQLTCYQEMGTGKLQSRSPQVQQAGVIQGKPHHLRRGQRVSEFDSRGALPSAIRLLLKTSKSKNDPGLVS